MTKILVLGYTLPGFIPPLNRVVPRAFNLRTAQLVEALINDGHEVLLCCRFHKGEIVPRGLYPIEDEKFTCIPGGFSTREWVKNALRSFRHFSPDAVLNISLVACMVATKLRCDKPLWMDIYGDPITDLQMILAARGHNRGLRSVLWSEHQALTNGDVFSVCSNPQRFALLGKLGRARRLEHRTFEYEFVHVILPSFTSGLKNKNNLSVDSKAKPPGENDHFNVIWYGGYNGWVDVDTLFQSLEYAMARNSRIRFISLGEGIGDSSLYDRFVQLVNGSSFRKRYELHGWQEYGLTREYCLNSHLGISVLKKTYETELGLPTRLVEMLDMGLPVLSIGSEFSEWLADQGAALTSEIGNVVGIGEAILSCARDQNLWMQLSRQGYQITLDLLSPERTAKKVREWAKDPYIAPDHKRDHRDIVIDNGHLVLERLLWKLFDTYI